MPPASVPSASSSMPTSVRTVKRATRNRTRDASPAPISTRPKAPSTMAARTNGVYGTSGLHFGEPDEVGHARIDAELKEERGQLAAVMRLVIEKMRHREPERIAPRLRLQHADI